MEGRIRQLEAILENAEVIEGAEDGVVAVGVNVTIVYDGDNDDAAEVYLIDTVEQRREGTDVITPGSPIGAALLGHREGDHVTDEAPNGASLGVKILKVATA